MKMPDALAPYASLIKWGLIALLSMGLFVSGCNHGENRGERDRVELEDKIELLENANASWAQEAEERTKLALKDQESGEQLMKEGSKAADRSEKEQKRTDSAVRDNQNKLDAALRNPKCAELLEMQVCSTVPLP